MFVTIFVEEPFFQPESVGDLVRMISDNCYCLGFVLIRTLAAADNAVMLVDAGKGLEPQTRKLFEVRWFSRISKTSFTDLLSLFPCHRNLEF